MQILLLWEIRSGRSNGSRLADKIVLNLEILQLHIYQIKYLTFRYVQQKHSVIIVISMHFSGFFQVKPTLRWILDMPKFWTPFFGSIPTIKYSNDALTMK